MEPSIYAADFSRLGAQLETLLAAGARIFHFDIGDGHFVSEITIGPVVLRSIAERVHEAGGVLDCHLMVSEPERHFAAVKGAGGDSVTFHAEVVDEPARAAALARELGLGVGVACNPETAVETAAAAAEAAGADIALCMSIHPGLSGQTLLADAPARIEQLRALLPVTMLLQVDGGISAGNAHDVRAAGADLLVAGSAVFWQDDMAGAFHALTAIVREGSHDR